MNEPKDLTALQSLVVAAILLFVVYLLAEASRYTPYWHR